MTLENFYFLAQILAALAIVGSLLFVGTQIKAHTREQRLVTSNMRNEKMVGLYADLASDAALRDILIRGSASFSDLSPSDALAFSSHWNRLCIIILEAETHHALGTIDGTIWERYKISYRSAARSKGAREWWQKRGVKSFAPYPRDILADIFDPGAETT